MPGAVSCYHHAGRKIEHTNARKEGVGRMGPFYLSKKQSHGKEGGKESQDSRPVRRRDEGGRRRDEVEDNGEDETR